MPIPDTTLSRIMLAASQTCYELEGRAVAAHLKSADVDDIQSEMDRVVSHLAREKLRAEGFFDAPGHIYLDEEAQKEFDHAALEGSDELFIIDPIDGSGAAMEGRPEYCIMAARFRRANDGTFVAYEAAVHRPRTMETLYWHEHRGVVYQEYALVPSLFRERAGQAACSPHEPRNMLFDYRFYRQFDWRENVPGNAVPKAHVNPSGFNMMDVALNRGLGFVFVYKPWDLCGLPIAQALGCEAYQLSAQPDGTFTGKLVTNLDLKWFEYDAAKHEFGKIKQPLLVCRPANKARILKALHQA